MTGNADAWNYLKMASEALLEGDAETANAIIEAASIRSPSGSLSLCYDERGNEYKVPDYCFSEMGPFVKAVKKIKQKSTGPPVKINIKFRVPGHAKDFPINNIDDTTSVGELKATLYDVMGKRNGTEPLPIARMRAIFAGRNLDDDKILRDAGIKNKCVVQIFPRPAEFS